MIADRIIEDVKIERLDHEYRWYVDPADLTTYESVTAIIGDLTPMPWLRDWAARLAAGFAVDNHTLVEELLLECTRRDIVALILGEAQRQRDLAADIGTYQHDVLEALLLDAPIPAIPPHLIGVTVNGERVDLDGLSDGLLNFLSDFDVQPFMAEATVCDPANRYAGTLDLGAVLCRLRVNRRQVVDLKTGKNLEPTVRAQVEALRRARVVWVNRFGLHAPMPQTDAGSILHLRPEFERRGYRLIPLDPIEADRAYRWFLRARAVRDDRLELASVMGAIPLYPPLADGSQPLPYVEDVTSDRFGAFRKPLKRGGIHTLAQLAEFTGEELQALKGIGPAAVIACAAVLDRFGMSLAPSPDDELTPSLGQVAS